MSEAYSIGCKTCKVMLWVGQDGMSGQTFYCGQPETMTSLGVFLFQHVGEAHSLTFDMDQKLGDAGFVEHDSGPVYQIHYRLGERTAIVQKPKYIVPDHDSLLFWGEQALDLEDLTGVKVILVQEGDPAFVGQLQKSDG